MKIIWKTICVICAYGIKILYYTRVIISNVLLLIFIITIIGIYLSLHHKTLISHNNALILDLNGIVVDTPTTYNKLHKISKNLLQINKSEIQENSLFDIVDIIRQAKNDPHITGLILSLKNFSGGNQSSLEYIGKVLLEFKHTGKLIYAISDYYNQAQYFLASYANKIYLTSSQGFVDLRGISTDKLYYKSLLDHLKINTHIFKVGTYKSAVEPFVRNSMSEKVRQSENIWVNQLWSQYLNTVATNRNIKVQQVFPGIHKVLDELNTCNGNTSSYALQKQWIDKISTNVFVENEMKKIFGVNQKETTFNSISMYDYHIKQQPFQHENQIAVICVQGTIIDGINNISGSIGGDLIVNKIRNARYNPKVKAIVIRINSPGGSVNASELIRLEIMNTRSSGKPVIISMGGVAASGGYWISTPANFIFASNSTITGSIGVFGMINTFERSLNSIGVYHDGINTSPISNISIIKPLPIEFKKIMQLHVNTSYQYFIQTVAQSRNKSIIDIDQIAQGQIWLGNNAVKNGLIDKIGDFDDAIQKAAELSNISEYQLNWYNEKFSWIDFISESTSKIIYNFFMKQLQQQTLFNHIPQSIITNYNNNIMKFIWNDPKYCYAFCLDSNLYY